MNDKKKAFDAINKVVADWDPLGVGESIAGSEYAGYIPKIMLVVKNGDSLFEHLSHVLVNELGGGYDPTNIKDLEYLKSVCDRIIEAYMKN